MADDFSPMYVGDLLAPLSVQFSHADGAAINLAGATFALVMVSSIGTRQIGAGTWTIDNAASGQAHYAWAAADVATAGTWEIQVAVTVSGQTEHCDPKLLVITPPL